MMSPLVLTHVIAGYLGLVSGLIVMILPKKGNRVHKKIGMVYFILMTIATSLAILLSILHPNRIFFLFIGIFTLHNLLGGFITTVKRYQKLKWMMLPLGIIGLANGAYMIYTGAIVLILFGGLQCLLGLTDIRMFLSKNLHPLSIIKAHAGKMAGSYTAATTAFIVNVIFTGGQWWQWMLPTFIITPISTWWGIQLDRKRKSIMSKQSL